MKSTFFILLGVFAFSFANAQSRSLVSIELTKKITNTYLDIKEKLLVSDSVEVKALAAEMNVQLNTLKMKSRNLDSLQQMSKLKKEMIKLTAEISSTGNINKQREAFALVSPALWKLENMQPMYNETLYLQVCPMTKVSWLSKEKEIKNPYYPKNMLDCGAVKGEITATE